MDIMNRLILCAVVMALYCITAYSQHVVEPKWMTPTATEGVTVMRDDGSKALQASGWRCSVLDMRKGTVISMFEFDGFNAGEGASFSHSGDKVAVAFKNGDVSILDVNTGKLLATSIGYPNRKVHSICFSKNDTRLVIYTFSNTVEVCDVNTGEKIHEFAFSNETIIQVNNISFFPRQVDYLMGDVIVTEDKENKIKIWDLSTGEVVGSFQAKIGDKLVSFSKDRTKLLLYNVGFLVVYDILKGEIVYRNDEKGGFIVSFNRKGNRIITTNTDNVNVINLESKKVELVVNNLANITYAECNYNGDKIAISTRYDYTYTWDVVSGKKISRLKVSNRLYHRVRFIGESDSLITFDETSAMKVWDIFTPKIFLMVDGGGYTRKLSLNKTNTHILALDQSSRMILYRAENGACVFSHYPNINQGSYFDASFNYSGDLIAVASEKDVTIFNIKGDSLAQSKRFTEDVVAIGFWNNADKLAICYSNGIMRVWDVRTWTMLYTRSLGLTDITKIIFTHDDTKFAVAHGYGGVSIYDAESGNELVLLADHTFLRTYFLFSATSQYIISYTDTLQTVYSTNNWKKIVVRKGNCSAINHKENLLAIAEYDSVTIWNLQSGELVTTLKGHLDVVVGMCFSPKDNSITTWSDDKTARLWNSITGKQIAILVSSKYLIGTVALFDEIGTTFILGNQRGIITAYDLSLLSTDIDNEITLTDDSDFCRVIHNNIGNSVRIELNEPAQNSVQYSVHNILGDLMVLGEISQGFVETTLSMENIPSGYYVLAIYDKQNMITQKIIKQ